MVNAVYGTGHGSYAQAHALSPHLLFEYSSKRRANAIIRQLLLVSKGGQVTLHTLARQFTSSPAFRSMKQEACMPLCFRTAKKEEVVHHRVYCQIRRHSTTRPYTMCLHYIPGKARPTSQVTSLSGHDLHLYEGVIETEVCGGGADDNRMSVIASFRETSGVAVV